MRRQQQPETTERQRRPVRPRMPTRGSRPRSSAALRSNALEWAAKLGPFIGLLAIWALFAAVAPPAFRSLYTTQQILIQTAVVGTAALGMTLIIIAGGIDLSVGSIIALATVVVAALLEAGVDPAAAAAGGILAGAICGLLNGAVITGLRVAPFIVTLGSMLMVRGLAKGLAREQKIDAPDSWLGGILSMLPPDQRWQIAPPGVWLMLGVAVLLAVVIRTTRFGRHLFAVGSNERAARLSGVPAGWVKLQVYTLGGALAGLAGLMQFSRLTVGDPTVSIGAELNVITAVVIGGGSLAGGAGSVPGTLVGALIMTVIAVGCTQMSVPNWVQEIVTGVIIVVAVAVDRLRHRPPS